MDRTIFFVVAGGLGLILFAILFALFRPFEVVDSGHRGVEVTFGQVVDRSLPEDLYWFNPFTTKIVEVDTRVQRFEKSEATYTKDIQQAQIAYVINFHLARDKAHIAYKDVGLDWQEKLVPQVISGALKNVIGKWDAVDLVENRQRASQEIETSVAQGLAEANVILTSFEITEIDFNDEFEHAVESKVVAVQEAIAEQNRSESVREKANQQIITAEAEARAMEIKTAALEKSRSLILYQFVERWDGKLPKILMGESVPMIQLAAEDMQ